MNDEPDGVDLPPQSDWEETKDAYLAVLFAAILGALAICAACAFGR